MFITEVSELPVEARRSVLEGLLTLSKQLHWIGPLLFLQGRCIDFSSEGRSLYISPASYQLKPALCAEEKESPGRKLDPGWSPLEGGSPDEKEGEKEESCCQGSASGSCTACWPLHPSDTLFRRQKVVRCVCGWSILWQGVSLTDRWCQLQTARQFSMGLLTFSSDCRTREGAPLTCCTEPPDLDKCLPFKFT